MTQEKIIGGDFFISSLSEANYNFAESLDDVGEHREYFSSGRDAIFSILKSVPYSHIWIPNLVCKSIIDACVDSHKEIKFYDANLFFDGFENSKFLTNLGPKDCVLLIHFFGIYNYKFQRKVIETGAMVIVDATHLLLNMDALKNCCLDANYVMASLRKTLGIPDGALVASNGCAPPQPWSYIREEFVKARFSGLVSRSFSSEFEFENDEGYKFLVEAEDLLNSSELGSYSQSYLSRSLLKTFNLRSEIIACSKNKNYLLKSLNKIDVNFVNSEVVSNFLVIRFQNKEKRDFVRNILEKNQIFLSVHWDMSFSDIKSSLSLCCLSIPCDSRFSEDDLSRVSNALHSSW